LQRLRTGIETMLNDLRGDYIRREEPGFFRKTAVTNAAIWLLASAVSTVLVWASLRFGDVSALAEPMGYFPCATPGAG
jgi:hypothetical protein